MYAIQKCIFVIFIFVIVIFVIVIFLIVIVILLFSFVIVIFVIVFLFCYFCYFYFSPQMVLSLAYCLLLTLLCFCYSKWKHYLNTEEDPKEENNYAGVLIKLLIWTLFIISN